MTLAQWLLCQSNDPSEIQAHLKTNLQALGYVFYDPFAGGTGTPVGLQQRTRSFISPAHGGWVRMLFAPNEGWTDEVTRDILAGRPVIRAIYFSGEQFEIGTVTDGIIGLVSFLRTGLTEADLQRALVASSQVHTASPDGGNLPSELQKFADEQGVDAQQVDKMMQKMAGSVFKKIGSEQDAQTQAKSAMAGATKQPEVDWNSPAGKALLGVMACLSVPEKWWQPDWKTLTGAYQAARQLQRDPKSPMLPGDKQAMAALPNALDFTPLYMGKKNS
ncbi:MAG: hypothetical protein HY862_04315 [Chloroflexi bacterium]|nr:hypothetical protein [Chloroflexota bacterium]